MAAQRKDNPKHPIDRGAPASVIAAKFGNPNKLRMAINRTKSTVHGWLVKGYIDNKYHPEIMEAARRLKVRINPSDFIDTRKPEASPE